jgi:hypothetical protein
MDYPAPLVRVRDDSTLDFSDAYAVGIGDWDIQAIRYAYSEFPPGADEGAALAQILDESGRRGLLFISGADARPPGAAHPLANLWDNGADRWPRSPDAREEIALGFGAHNVARGRRSASSMCSRRLFPSSLTASGRDRGGRGDSEPRRARRGDHAAEAAPVAPRASAGRRRRDALL